MPLQTGDETDGQLGHRLLFAGGGVEQVEDANAVFVGDKRQGLAVRGEFEAAHVPLDVAGQRGVLLAGEIDVDQAAELGVLVGGDVEAFAVLAELGA